MKIRQLLYRSLLLTSIGQIFVCYNKSTCFAETLEEAWALAISTNHSLKAVADMTDSADLLLKSAQAARYPQLSLHGGYTALSESPAMLMYTGAENMQIPMGDDHFYAASAKATLPLYTSGGISHGIKSAEFGSEAAMAEEKNRLRNLKFDVGKSFVHVLLAARGVSSADSHVKSLTAHREIVEDMYDEGFVALNDLLAIRVALANARQQLLTTLDNHTITIAVYNRFLGRSLAGTVALEEPDIVVPNQSLAQLTVNALEERPELVILNHQIDALTEKEDMIYSSYGPQVALSGGYDYQENEYQVHEGSWAMTIGLSVQFDGGVAKYQGGAIGKQREALREQRLELESIIPLQVKDASLSLSNSRKRVEVAREALSGSEENLELTTDRYQEGLAINSEVLDAEALRMLSHVNYDNAVYDVVLASLRLLHAVGIL